jgi:hypothetical protein
MSRRRIRHNTQKNHQPQTPAYVKKTNRNNGWGSIDHLAAACFMTPGSRYEFDREDTPLCGRSVVPGNQSDCHFHCPYQEEKVLFFEGDAPVLARVCGLYVSQLEQRIQKVG